MSRTSLSRLPGPDDFNGAALVDEQGREIPITEAMILRACCLALDNCVTAQYRALQGTSHRAWRYPRQADRKAG